MAEEARSTAVDYGPSVGLVVVDMQNDFASPDGNLYVAGGEEVVSGINEEIAKALAAGATVVYTQDWHPPVTPHFAKHGGVWPVHCVKGTWGAELHPELEVAGPIVQKGTGGEDGYSGFTVRHPETGDEKPTSLEETLRSHGVERVVIVGLAGDVCVRATALDAQKLGFATTVIRPHTRCVELEPGDEEAAFAEMTEAGVRIESLGA